MALILDGGSRSEAAKFTGVTLQIMRDWVLRFNAEGPEGLATRKAPGRASILNDEQRARLIEAVEAGPIPAAHGVVRWRLADLAQWVDGQKLWLTLDVRFVPTLSMSLISMQAYVT